MATNVSIKTPNFGSLVGLGGSTTKQTSASPGGALQRLREFFVGTRTDAPKVVAGGPNRGDLLLNRTGQARPMNLQHLRQAPLGKTYLTSPAVVPSGAPMVAVAAPAPTTVAASPKPQPRLGDQIEALHERVAVASDAAGEIARLRRTVAGDRSDGRWAANYAQLVDKQQTAAAAIDKDLATVSGLLAASAGKPEATRELQALRAQLVEHGLAVQFSGVAQGAELALPQGALGDLRQALASFKPADEAGRAALNGMVQELGTALRQAERDGGRPALDRLATAVDKLLRVVGGNETTSLAAPTLLGKIDAAEGRKAAEGLRYLRDLVNTKIGLADAVQHFAAAVSGTPPMPLGPALRAVASGMPSLRDWGNSPVPTQARYAAESLATLGELLAKGEVPDTLLGHDLGFDKTALSLKTAWAERTAEQHLTDTHKLLALPDPTPAEIKTARQEGAQAASQRHELTLANRRLEGLLKTDRRVWHQPSTWGDKGLVFGEGSAGSVRKDARLMTALRHLGGKDAGRDVALLMARISDLELKTLKLERSALGLHPKLDTTKLEPKPGDPRGPLAHLGVDRQDLARMGLTGSDVAKLEQQVTGLAKQGLGNAAEVKETIDAINHATERLMRSTLAHGAMDAHADFSTQAGARRLMTDIMQDVSGQHGDRTLTPASPEVADGFNARMVAAQSKLLREGGTDAMAALFTGAETYRQGEAEITAQLQAHAEVDTRVAACRQLLTEKRDSLGLDLDPTKPKGLDSGKALLRALDADLRAKDGSLPPAERRAAETARDRALDQLKGFDASRLSRPWHGRIASLFTGSRPDIATLAQFRQAAEAIVYIREGAAADKAIIKGQIEQHGGQLDGLLAARREAHGEVVATARSAIRAAVLASWPAGNRELEVTGGRIEGYNPAAKRTEIEAQLRAWGVNTDLFAPEIDEALYGTLGKDDIQAWRDDTPFSRAGQRAMAETGSQGVTDFFRHRGDMDEATRRNFLSTLEGLQGDDVLSIKVGNRITFDSGKIPVETTGTLGVKARVSGAGQEAFDVALSGENYMLMLRSGVELKGAVGAVAGQGFGDFVKGEVSAEIEGTHTRLDGVAMSFPKTEEGRAKLIAMVKFMTEGGEADVDTVLQATQAFAAKERSTRGQLNLAAVARAEIGDKATGLGIGASAGVTGSLALAGKSAEVANLNQRTRRGEFEVTAAVGANVGAYAKVFNLGNLAGGQAGKAGFQEAANDGLGTKGGKPLYDVSSPMGNQDLLALGVGASVSYVRKWREVSNPDGHLALREIVKQTNVKVSPLSVVSTLGSTALRERAEGNEDFRRDLGLLMGHMRSGDSVIVAYALEPGKLQQANSLLSEARTLRRDGRTDQATALERQAHAIAEDEDNYLPSKISLVPTLATKEEIGNINARFLRWDTYRDSKFEHPAIVLTVPAA